MQVNSVPAEYLNCLTIWGGLIQELSKVSKLKPNVTRYTDYKGHTIPPLKVLSPLCFPLMVTDLRQEVEHCKSMSSALLRKALMEPRLGLPASPPQCWDFSCADPMPGLHSAGVEPRGSIPSELYYPPKNKDF